MYHSIKAANNKGADSSAVQCYMYLQSNRSISIVVDSPFDRTVVSFLSRVLGHC